MMHYYSQIYFILQGDIEKGLEMKKLVLSGFLASEEIYLNQLEALLLVRDTNTCKNSSSALDNEKNVTFYKTF